MGVPGFFAWILKRYKKDTIITYNIQTTIDIFYIDANCLFHPQCQKVLSTNSNKDKLELYMINRILDYLDYIIGFINPKLKVFISVDGVAPMTKINQQRKRRFKSIIDNEIRDKIKYKFHKQTINNWSNVAITPGTEFMEQLHLELIKYTKSRNNSTTKYIYSSYHTIGEGEHKILQDIKLISDPNITYAIYGLDADLFFLAMASKKQNIYLIREENFLNSTPEDDDVNELLNYVSVDKVKECINTEFRIFINTNINPSIDFVDDFILICYLLGNDFIPHIPSINIKNFGIEILLDIYTKVYIKYKTTILTNTVINNNIFMEYLKELSNIEDFYFTTQLPKYNESLHKRKCHSYDDYEQAIWNFDNMKLININDPIQLGFDSPNQWKFRYYEHYYNVIEYQQEHINNMCKEYLTGIIWTLQYYMNKCICWKWQYVYNHAPFISDIYNYCTKIGFDINTITFVVTKPIQPLTQLLAVVPPSLNKLLPHNYRQLMTNINSPIIDLYPTQVSQDLINKDAYWKCIPIIPIIQIDRIESAIKDIKLSIEEEQRNQFFV